MLRLPFHEVTIRRADSKTQVANPQSANPPAASPPEADNPTEQGPTAAEPRFSFEVGDQTERAYERQTENPANRPEQLLPLAGTEEAFKETANQESQVGLDTIIEEPEDGNQTVEGNLTEQLRQPGPIKETEQVDSFDL